MEIKTYRNPYQETKDNIFCLRLELTNLERDLKRIIELSGPKPVQAQQYDVSGSGNTVENVNDLYGMIVEIKKKINEIIKKLEELKVKKKKIEENFLLSLNETERRVFLLKNKNLTHFEIAIKLNKSEGYIKIISSSINKKMVEWERNLQKTEFIY